MWVIKNLMIKTTTNETKVLNGNITSFVIPISFIWIYGCFRLNKHIIHLYFLFLLSLIIQVFLGSNGSVLWYVLIFFIDHILSHPSWNLWLFPILVEVPIISNTH
jgi:hypothetical protein